MVEIVTRGEWGARYSDGFRDAPLPASEVWLHHSVTPAPPDDRAAEARAVRRLERIGQNRFGGGMSYTFLVVPSGRVYEGHSVGREGAHTLGHNDVGRAVCLVGNYEGDEPTGKQLNAVAGLLRLGAGRGWWQEPRLDGGHRDLKVTACPGSRAYRRIPDINRRAADAAGTEDDEVGYHETWWGGPGERLIPSRHESIPDGWPEYFLGTLPRWTHQWIKGLSAKVDRLTDLVAEQNGVSADEIAEALRASLAADLLDPLVEAMRDKLEAVYGDDWSQRAAVIADEVIAEAADAMARRDGGGSDG